MADKGSDSVVGKVLIALLPAITAFAGFVYGASLNDRSQNELLKSDKFRQERLSAYVDFINARRKLYRNKDDADAAIAQEQASTRIAIYGDEEVVHAIADTWRTGQQGVKCGAEWLVDLSIYENIRKDVSEKQVESQLRNDMAQIILKCKIE